MVTQEVTINNEVGLHARPATFFIQKANEFKSGIWVEKDERRVDAKSLACCPSASRRAPPSPCLPTAATKKRRSPHSASWFPATSANKRS